MSKALWSAGLAVALSLCWGVVSARAEAQEAAPPPASSISGFSPMAAPGGGFGSAGQWVLSLGGNNDEYLLFHHQTGSGWQLGLRPSADTFIINNLSVGGVVGFFHSDAGETDLSLGARAGYNLNIADKIGFWPTAGLSFTHASHLHGSDNHASLDVFAPFLYHLAPHFFVGVGPSFSLALGGGGSNQIGIDAVLGGWF